jgi:hypothetical protein
MSYNVDCTGLKREIVLAHLYNNAKPLRMGFLQAKTNPMSVKEAAYLLSKQTQFDYLHGRPMKINFDKWPSINTRLYDRDQGGPGTAARLIQGIKETGKISQAVKFQEKTKEELDEIKKECDGSVSIISVSNYGGKCPKDFPDLKHFHTVNFTKTFCDFLKEQGLPYPYDWCIFMGKTASGNYKFAGSMGGSFVVGSDQPCIKSTGHAMGIC